MAKTKAGKKRRLKGTVRKTIATLLMVTSVTVAALPVPEIIANDGRAVAGVTWDDNIKKSSDGGINYNVSTSSGKQSYEYIVEDIAGTPSTLFKVDEDGVIFGYNSGFVPQGNTLEIPNTITVSSNGVSNNQPAAEKIISLKYIADNTFKTLSVYSNVILPETLLGIGESAFEGCSGLSRIDLGKGVQRIGDYAFANCTNLVSATIATPSACALVEMGKGAFGNCVSLSEVTIPEPLKIIGKAAFFGCNSLGTVDMSSKKQTLKIGDYAYANCKTLNQVIFSDYMNNEIGKELFNGCSTLERVVFPSGYSENIPAKTFANCENLKSVYLKNSNTSFDNNEFSADNLGNFYEDFYLEGLYNSASYNKSMQQGLAYKYQKDGVNYFEKQIDSNRFTVDETNKLVKYAPVTSTVSSNVIIPNRIGGYNIESISASNDCFKENKKIQKITTNSALKNIESEAFYGCDRLRWVSFADSPNIVSIGAKAFYSTDPGYKLCFEGDISYNYVPFKYAMSPNNYIYTRQNDTTTFILYKSPMYNANLMEASGSNIYVLYDNTYGLEEGKRNTLVAYPEKRDVGENVYNQYIRWRLDNSVPISEDDKYSAASAINIKLPEGVEKVDGSFQHGYKDVVNYPDIKDIYAETFSVYNSQTGTATPDDESVVEVIEMNSIKTLDDRAFSNSTKLQKITFSPLMESLGSVPFLNCENLKDVIFKNGSPNYAYDKGIVYGLKDGAINSIETVVPARGNLVGDIIVASDETSKVTSIAPEAFYACEYITEVHLGGANKLEQIPEKTFKDCSKLRTIELPKSIRAINAEAFVGVDEFVKVTIPVESVRINETAFDLPSKATIRSYEGSTAHAFQKEYAKDGLRFEALDIEYTVRFKDYYGKVIKEQIVEAGKDAEPPKEMPEVPDMVFTGWNGEYKNITENKDLAPVYAPKKDVFTVTFVDWNGNTLGEVQQVQYNRDAVPPVTPVKEGSIFKEWAPDYKQITKNTVCIAVYDPILGKTYQVKFINHDGLQIGETQVIEAGKNASPPSANPVKAGSTFTGWLPTYEKINEDTICIAQFVPVISSSSSSTTTSGSTGATSGASSSSSSSSSSSRSSSSKSSTSAKGSTTTTIIQTPAPGVSASTTAVSTSTANSGGTDTGGNDSGGSGNANLDLDKSGITDKDKGSVNVTGTTENYTVKITDSEDAKSAVESALAGALGTLDNLRYFPMDISLYDAAGVNKISPVPDGVSVNVTLPLPDDLRIYGGNVRPIAVSGSGQLEVLSPKFSIIDSIPCVTFTATHFSPYGLYVDTANLTAGDIQDNTPKTGDPIHPKWFLSIGLAAISVLLFLRKEPKNRVKTA